MCGRIKREKVDRLIRDVGFEDFRIIPRYNAAPMQFIEVLRRNDSGQIELTSMRWGLYGGAGMINARSETLETRPAFKSLLKRQRCVVPVDGFYEWRKAPKQPYLISMQDDAPFGLAGLWVEYMTPHEVFPTFTVITTEANALVMPLHDRMPVIVNAADAKTWLSDTPFESVRALLRSFPANEMKVVAVHHAVNNVRNEGPECGMPLTGPTSLFD